MTTFYVVTNGSYTTVVSHDGDASAGATAMSQDAVLQEATKRFKAAGLDAAGLKVTHEIDELEHDHEGWGDGPSDIGLSDGAFLRVAEDMGADEDVSIDSDAVVSAFNVMAWKWIDPKDALHHLADSEPVANCRGQASRDTQHDASLNAARAAVAAFDRFQASPDAASLKALAEVMRGLEAALSSSSGDTEVKFSSVINSWEAIGNAEHFAAMSDDQRKPWRLKVSEESVNQLRVDLWPASEDVEESTSGLGLFIEVDDGVPTVHVAPGPNSDAACHIRYVSSHQVRVSPGTLLPARDDSACGPGFVFTNGGPQA